MVVASLLGALMAAGVWSTAAGDGVRVSLVVAFTAIGGVLSLGGSSVFFRAETDDVRILRRLGPDRDEPSTGESLTAVSIFPFVALLLFAAGLVLFSSR